MELKQYGFKKVSAALEFVLVRFRCSDAGAGQVNSSVIEEHIRLNGKG
jgi:hypothetical protein